MLFSDLQRKFPLAIGHAERCESIRNDFLTSAALKVLFLNRRLDPDVKVIAASGLSLNQNSLQDAGTQVLAFLPKPYTAEKLLVTLHEHLRAA